MHPGAARVLGRWARPGGPGLASAWRRVSLDVPARKFKNPRVFEQHSVLAGAKLRQLSDLGHEQPTILLTNERDTSQAKLLTRYAQRMLRWSST